MQDKFLPVGTVCKLKGASQKVAITGFCMKNQNVPDTIFDYVACYYPQGILDKNKNILFNHEQIEQVIFMGFVNDEELAFKAKIKKALESQEQPKKKSYDPSIFDMEVPVASFVTDE